MPISTGEIVMLAFLAIMLGVAIFWFIVSFRYGRSLKEFAYARGANVDPGVGKTTGAAKMECDGDREICVQKATAVCTGTNGVVNYESTPLNPYSNGSDGKTPYGAFNPSTTADLTSILSTAANGKESYTYNFDGKASLPKCVGTGANNTIRPQLIATYVCVPKGQSCPKPNSS